MAPFCESVIREIKSADTEVELAAIIHSSVNRFRTTRNANNEAIHIMNMIVSLQALKMENLDRDTMTTINMAVKIFRQYQKKCPERLF